MKINIHQPLTQIALGILAGVGLTPFLLPQTTLAQSIGTAQPNETFPSNETSNSFSRNGSFDPKNFIHCANLGNCNINMGNYIQDQKAGIEDAATKFRRLQLERLRNQNQPAGVAPVAPIAPPTAITLPVGQ
jgi:hypothetical protein